MTEKQRNKVKDIASVIFTALDQGHTVRDDKGNVVEGLRYGTRYNPSSWSYVSYNEKSHLVPRPVMYSDNKNAYPCKRFIVEISGKKPKILK